MKGSQKPELDMEKTARFLGLSVSRLERLLEKRLLSRNWGKYTNFFRFETSVSGIERGSVLLQKGDGKLDLILGFPKIQRAMLLEPSINNQFSEIDKLIVEEKMNGYNVRVIENAGKLIAFTRSGHICPYSTEKVNYLLDPSFFRQYPDLVVHGEMAGPENPYVSKKVYDTQTLDFFVFDIRHKKTGEPLPVRQRRELATSFGFKQVPFLGEFERKEAAEKIMQIIKKLGEMGHEGVVIKDLDMDMAPIKYTCSQSNCADLEHAFKFYNEVGRDYLYSRVVREGFQTVEWDEDEETMDQRCLRLGRSIISPMADSVRRVGNGEKLYDEVTLRFQNPQTLQEFEEYFRRLGIDAIFDRVGYSGGELMVNLQKLNQSTTDKTKSMWEGNLW